MSVFDDLVGQEPAVRELRSAAASAAEVLRGGSGAGMTHAWLFTGPPGSGRSVAARAFAAALQCPDLGCGECDACRHVLAGTHADVEVVRPSGLSYGVKDSRDLVLRAGSRPSGGRWQVVCFEDADRATEQAANVLLKAIEEPAPRTVWLLCAPSPEDLVLTIRSRCRLVTLRTPPSAAVAEVLVRRDGIDTDMAAFAARAAQGHIGRARRLATDAEARRRREEVLRIPLSLDGIGACLSAAAQLVEAAEGETNAAAGELDAAETAELRRALGEREGGKGLPRGSAAVLRDLEERQKSRTTRMRRDALDRALLDLASFYRDVLIVQAGSGIDLANADKEEEIRGVASGAAPETTLRRLEAIMECRERLEANANPLLAVEAMTVSLQFH
ncbi:MAG: DNA polymerase III subunit delta' [Streptosporangiales bacterium]|nr:DNA polymerase III subunit delta' [Streptosporangiales bacterium]